MATTTRSAARLERVTTIKAAAARQLASRGAASLSLREVAREIGVASSAIYRYFATRDELLTALITDAYNELGASVETAEAVVARSRMRERWRVACRAVRSWALAHPHDYALLYGTPVPDYRAPTNTIGAASRVTRVLGRIVDDAAAASPTTEPAREPGDVAGYLDVDNVAAELPRVAPDRYARALLAWSSVFGSVTFELFGHFVGSVTNAATYFERVIDELADLLGLGD